MSRIVVKEADFSRVVHADAIIRILNEYAEDVMGMEESLDESVKRTLVDGLADFPGTLCLLAFAGNKAVGIANCFYGFSTFNAMKVLNIHDLAVVSGFRGRGIGKALLQAVEKKARDTGCCKVTLEVRGDNPARSLYEHVGYSCGDPVMYFMTKELV